MARVALGNLSAVVKEYIETVLEPASVRAGGALPMIIGFAKVWIPNQAMPKMIQEKMPLLKSLYLVDEKGFVDTDAVIDTLIPILETNPIIWQGYRFDKGDLEKMREIAKRYASNEEVNYG